MHNSQASSHEKPAFFDKPKNVSILMYSFYVISIVLVAVDFFIHRHELKLADGNLIKTLEQMPTFYAVYGFVGCSLLVFGAKLMRIFMMREENYYDQRDDEAFYSTPNAEDEGEAQAFVTTEQEDTAGEAK